MLEDAMAELPPSSFRVVSNEASDKLKVCFALSGFTEDFAEVESVLGKSLIKLGSQSFMTTKSDCLPNSVVAWELLFKILTTSSGKQQCTFSTNLQQNICKMLPEASKSYKRKLQVVLTKILGIIDDLKKAKSALSKSIERYGRLAHDTEAAVRSRDNYQDTDPKTDDDSFVNRSINKMFSKITPNEKYLVERCRELVKEMLTVEDQISSQIQLYNDARQNMLSEIIVSFKEVEVLEGNRLGTMRDALQKLILAFSVDIETRGERFASIKEQLGDGYAAVEYSKIISEIEIINNKSYPALTSGLDVSKISEKHGDYSDSEDSLVDRSQDVERVFGKIDKLIDVLNSLRALGSRGSTLLAEVAENEKQYCKGVKKMMSKHAFPAANSEGDWGSGFSPTEERSTDFGFIDIPSTREPACQVLSRLESPSSRAAWMCAVTTISGLVGLHYKTALTYTDGVCRRIHELNHNIDMIRKDLQDKRSFNTKMIETAQTNSNKTHAKLSKLQILLKERKSTLKKAKESNSTDAKHSGRNTTGRAGSGTYDIPPLSENATDATMSDLSDRESDQLDHVPSLGAHVTSTRAESDDGSYRTSLEASDGGLGHEPTNKKRPSGMMQGFENLSSTLRGKKLTEVVGLETPASRISRIEKQVSSLEREEQQLIGSVRATTGAEASIVDLALSELEQILSATEIKLSSCMEALYNELESVIYSGVSALEQAQILVEQLRASVDRIDFNMELQFFVSHLRQKIANAESDPLSVENASILSLLLDIPTEENFVPVRGEVLTTEIDSFLRSISPTLTTDIVDTPILETEYVKPSEDIISIEENPPVGAEEESELLMESEVEPNSENNTFSEAALIVEASSTEQVELEQSSNPEINTSTTFTIDSAFDIDSSKSAPPVLEESQPCPTALSRTGEPQVDDETLTSTSQKAAGQKRASSLAAAATASLAAATAAMSPSSLSAKLDQTSNAELSKFGLGPLDKVLDSYSCALYPKKGILTHGRMFITQKYVAFSGWPDTRVLLSLAQVKAITKTNTLVYIPNAISITMEDDSAYFFGSFIERDACHSLLNNLSTIEKRINELNGAINIEPTDASGENLLELGYQTRQTIFRSTADGSISAASPTGAVPQNGTAGAGMNSSAAINRLRRISQSLKTPDRKNRALSPGSDFSDKLSPVNEREEELQEEDGSTRSVLNRDTVVETNVVQTVRTDVTRSKTVVQNGKKLPMLPPKSPMSAFSNSPFAKELPEVSLDGLFATRGIELLQSENFEFPVISLWRSLWLHSSGYGDFLAAQGDLNIAFTEWIPFDGKVEEDISNLKYSYRRSFSYEHPRTTMLFIGPKTIKTKQEHYLFIQPNYCGEGGSGKGNQFSLDELAPQSGVVLTVTQMEGVPMCDVFKVTQYWHFETCKVDPLCSSFHVGFNMFFSKNSMFKSQIVNGTKDELKSLVNTWFRYVAEQLEQSYPESSVGGEEASEYLAPSLGILGVDSKLSRSASMRKGVTKDSGAEEGKGDSSNFWVKLSFQLGVFLLVFMVLIVGFFYLLWNQNRELSMQMKLLSAKLEENKLSLSNDMHTTHVLLDQMVKLLSKK